MDVELATAVITIAREQGITKPMPESDKEKISAANELVELASVSHFKNNNNSDAVMAVLNVAGRLEDPDEQAEEEVEAEVAPAEEAEPEPTVDGGTDDVPEAQAGGEAGGDEAEAGGEGGVDRKDDWMPFNPFADMELAKEKARRERLPEPQLPVEMQSSPDPVPSDVTKLDDTSFRRLHWQRHMLDIRASYLASVEKGYAEATKRIADHEAGKIIKQLESDNPGRSVTGLKVEAEADEIVGRWRRNQREHAASAQEYGALADSYRKDCERLSWDYTMRKGQRDNAGQVTPDSHG